MGLLDSFFRRVPTASGGDHASSMRSQTVAESKLEEGMRMEREGRLDEALDCYDAAIALAPDLARAHFNRGNILLDRGDAFEALPSYRKAIELKPDSATAHYNLGNAYLQLGNLQDSVTALRTAITLKPDFLDAHITLGLIHGKLGHEREAQLSFSNATRINADSAEIYCRIASCWLEAGFEQFAIHNVQRALSLQPDMVDALRLWGLACQRLKHTEDAIEYFRRGLSMQPDNAELLNHLGTAFRDSGRHDTAIDCYRRALAINPDLPVAHYNLGESLQSLGQSEDAISCYQRCLALGQSHYAVYISLAAALRDLGRDNEALARFEQAIALQPDNPAGYIHRGVTLAMLGRLQEAQEDYQRALLLQPDNADAQLSMGVVLKDLGDVSNALTYVQRALEIQSDYVLAHNNLLFIQNYLAEQSGEQLLADARRFGEVAARLAKPYTDWPNPPDPARPLRVGLVSGDLGHHPVGFFLEGVLSELTTRAGDRLAFFAYSHRLEEDTTSQRLRACCQGWLKTMGLSDEALARRIRDDRIDILIDLAGHTSGNRLAMFAWKPAPVQVSWLGYFATTGVAAMDYFLADPWTLPPEQEPFFTEQVWRLPETRLCFTPPDSQAQVNVLPALARGYVTFGCFNNLSKMNDAVVQLWAQVLQAVPNSRLLLKYRQLADASVRQRTAERFALHGISAQRLVFEGHSSRSDYLAAYHQVDIALDPFPFPGGTTTVEALWMGVPVLTLQGERFLARQGVGLLMNAGLPEWVAADAQDYVRRASAHASDLPALAALRSRLRQQVLASPIYDAPRFAQHFETALRSIWQLWCA